jgi:hypothetical protein
MQAINGTQSTGGLALSQPHVSSMGGLSSLYSSHAALLVRRSPVHVKRSGSGGPGFAMGEDMSVTSIANDDLDALRRRLRIMEDKEEIRDLLTRYGYTADLGLFDDFVETLTDDCLWEAGSMAVPGAGAGAVDGVMRGKREAMSAVSGPQHASIVNREQHLMVNFIIQVDGDEAQAVGHLAVTLHYTGGFGLATCRLCQARFRRIDGQWLISQIRFYETGDTRARDMIVATGLLTSPVR